MRLEPFTTGRWTSSLAQSAAHALAPYGPYPLRQFGGASSASLAHNWHKVVPVMDWVDMRILDVVKMSTLCDLDAKAPTAVETVHGYSYN